MDLADLEVAIPALVLVVRQHDVPRDLLAEAGLVLELALRESGLHRRAPELVREDVLSIQPVLDASATDHDPR